MSELVDLSGRTALVTGAAQGIGSAIARRLHEAGAAVVLADTNEDEASLVAAGLDARRADSAVAVRTDVLHEADAQRAVTLALERFGSLDILVNNAGIYPVRRFSDLDVEDFARVVSVNLVGPFLMMRAAVPAMIAAGRGGRIINITSIDALHPSMVGLSAYDSSKHGLWGLTQNLALELAEHGIAVNALAPGAIATPGVRGEGIDAAAVASAEATIPMGRMGDPDEIGCVALFLASDLASYLTGSQLVADGGMLLA